MSQLCIASCSMPNNDTKIKKKKPNILITGTPGVGKTLLCKSLCDYFDFTSASSRSLFRYISLSNEIVKNKLYDEWDDYYQVPIFNEEKIINFVKPFIGGVDGGVIIDFHSGEFFPVKWFDLVIVLRAKTEVIYDRLKERGYPEKKINENLESEIFGVVLEDILLAYEGKVSIWIKENNTFDQLNETLLEIEHFVLSYSKI